eukprot:1543653-Rhodomonas_salina.1
MVQEGPLHLSQQLPITSSAKAMSETEMRKARLRQHRAPSGYTASSRTSSRPRRLGLRCSYQRCC